MTAQGMAHHWLRLSRGGEEGLDMPSAFPWAAWEALRNRQLRFCASSALRATKICEHRDDLLLIVSTRLCGPNHDGFRVAFRLLTRNAFHKFLTVMGFCTLLEGRLCVICKMVGSRLLCLQPSDPTYVCKTHEGRNVARFRLAHVTSLCVLRPGH